MTERFFGMDRGVDLDNQFRLRVMMGGREIILEPCAEIKEPELMIGVVDNNHISPKRLMLVEKDQQPIKVKRPDSERTETLSYPGKSAFLVLGDQQIERNELTGLVRGIFSRQLDRRDHLHCATVSEIQAVGWRVFWAPLQDRGIIYHARLVAKRTMDGRGAPTLEDATRLSDILSRQC